MLVNRKLTEGKAGLAVFQYSLKRVDTDVVGLDFGLRDRQRTIPVG